MVAEGWFRLAMVVAVSAAWAVGGPVSSVSASQPMVTLGVVGPVIRSDAPDPSILEVGHNYYAYTTDSGGNNVPVYESTDLVHWRLVGDASPVLPPWAAVGYSWSPSVTVAPGGGYQLFYDAYDEGDGEQCIGRATASSPLGPFVDSSSTPFLCQQALGGSIDASVFQQHGRDDLVWNTSHEAVVGGRSGGGPGDAPDRLHHHFVVQCRTMVRSRLLDRDGGL
jgi:beta-xylosidase